MGQQSLFTDIVPELMAVVGYPLRPGATRGVASLIAAGSPRIPSHFTATCLGIACTLSHKGSVSGNTQAIPRQQAGSLWAQGGGN